MVTGWRGPTGLGESCLTCPGPEVGGTHSGPKGIAAFRRDRGSRAFGGPQSQRHVIDRYTLTLYKFFLLECV